MHVPILFLCHDLLLGHVGKRKIVLTNIQHAEVVRLGHGKTFCRAYGGTQSAEATLAHVDVELRSIDALRSTVGCFTKLFGRANGLDGDTIYRADLHALVADDAVVHLIVELVTTVVGNWNGFVGKLDGGNTNLLLEITFAGDVDRLFAVAGGNDMLARKF